MAGTSRREDINLMIRHLQFTKRQYPPKFTCMLLIFTSRNNTLHLKLRECSNANNVPLSVKRMTYPSFAKVEDLTAATASTRSAVAKTQVQRVDSLRV
jgi:hypothetical protein